MFFESIAKLSQSTRIAISVVAVALPAVACYSWMVAPHTRYLSAAQQYAFVANDVARKNQIIKSKTALKKRELMELQQHLEQTQGRFFTTEEAKKFFRDIETLSEETGCTIISSEYVDGAKSEKRTAQQVDSVVSKGVVVTFAADYESIKMFIAKLLDRPQKVAVDSLEMAVAGNGTSLLCEATFKIFVIDNKETFSDEQTNVP
jgi:hypothetical protein